LLPSAGPFGCALSVVRSWPAATFVVAIATLGRAVQEPVEPVTVTVVAATA
jgi:hypothetical protein